PRVRLVLVGKGESPEDERAIRAEAQRLGLADRVTITGWMPIERAWGYIKLADVCLSPYSPTPILQSTSPTKLIEYMALGRPVVANDHPEQSEVIRDSGAGLCCAGDEAAFASAVLRILRDPDAAERMGAAGRRYVERKRTHAALADAVVSRYCEVLAPRTVGREAVRKPLKVCVVVPAHWSGLRGGAEYQASLLAARLVKRYAVELTYLTTQTDPDFVPEGYGIARFSDERGIRRYGTFLDALR